MGYIVHFKKPSLSQIFTHSAGRYINDCVDQLNAAVAEAEPGQPFAGVIARPEALHLGKTPLTDELRAKVEALPFVSRIESWEEAKKSLTSENRVARKIKGWVMDLAYRD